MSLEFPPAGTDLYKVMDANRLTDLLSRVRTIPEREVAARESRTSIGSGTKGTVGETKLVWDGPNLKLVVFHLFGSRDVWNYGSPDDGVRESLSRRYG